MMKHTTMMTEETQLVANSSKDGSPLLMQRKHRILGAVVLCITFFGVGLRMGATTTDTIIIPNGDSGGVPASMMAVQLASSVAVTSDDSCAREVPGAGPCCDGGSIILCSKVCDYLLMCDDGYVPVPFYTDDAATRFPETSDYQPHNCHCRGYEDHNGCFCRQIRDMIEHVVDHAGIGSCDACPSPPPSPTHSPTEPPTCKEGKGNYLDDGRRNVDTSKPFYSCFEIKGSYHTRGVYCWTESIQIHGVNVGCYPSGYSENNRWKEIYGTGNDNCGAPCAEFDPH